jgi:hypothetical protein
MVYQSEFLDMEPRYKSTGFEKILPNALEAKVKLEAAFGSRLEVYRFPVQRMLGQLTGTTLFT